MTDEAPPSSEPTSGPRVIAGSRLPWLASLGIPLAAVDGGTGLGLAAALAYDGALVAGAWMEGRLLGAEASLPEIARVLDGRLVLGEKSRVTLKVRNRADRTIRIRIRDEVPPGFAVDPAELEAVLGPHGRASLTYHVTPSARGEFELGDVYVRIDGALRLGSAAIRIPAREKVRVYPSVLGVRGHDLTARKSMLKQVGLRSVRLTGGAGEYEQLREYVPGDPYKDLDWKSTAKRQRPVTRVYQQERSQNIVLALDAGRTMATRLGDMTKLDHAVRAALLLAYVALRQGDLVGLVIFADNVKAYVPPGRGMGQYRRLLDAIFPAQPEVVYVDYKRLVEHVALRIKKRALFVLFSDLLDEGQAEPLVECATMLRRKHLPLCVTMNDTVADQVAALPVRTPMDAFDRAAATDVLAERERIKTRLRKAGVGLVEAAAAELAVATVDRYLQLKSRLAL